MGKTVEVGSGLRIVDGSYAVRVKEDEHPELERALAEIQTAYEKRMLRRHRLRRDLPLLAYVVMFGALGSLLGGAIKARDWVNVTMAVIACVLLIVIYWLTLRQRR